MIYHFNKNNGLDEISFFESSAEIARKLGKPDKIFKRTKNAKTTEHYYISNKLLIEYSESQKAISFQVVSGGALFDVGKNLLNISNAGLDKLYHCEITSKDEVGFICKKYGIAIYHSAFNEAQDELPESILVFCENYWDDHEQKHKS